MTYRIVRFYQQHPSGTRRRVLDTGLALEEAQAHCRDKETSSSTCTKPGGRERTMAFGPWFDGYEQEG